MYDDLFSSEAGVCTIVTSPYRLHATLRIYHDDLEPDELTRRLDVMPTKTQKKGEPLTPFKPSIKTLRKAPVGGWFLDSEGRVESKDANTHIEWILDQMAHCTGALHDLQRQGYRIDIHVGWFAESDNTCPSLSSDIMRRLGICRLDCWFDIYLFPPGAE